MLIRIYLVFKAMQQDLGLDYTNIIVCFMYWFPFLLFWQNTTKK